MTQTLSISRPSLNPYTEVTVTSIIEEGYDGRRMAFGEYIDPKTGKYTETIINPYLRGDDSILYLLKVGDVVHTGEPRESTADGVTRRRVRLRHISEQPIYIQERHREAGGDQGAAVDQVAIGSKPKESLPNSCMPKTVTLPKTTARFAYVQELADGSCYKATDQRRYGKALGELVDYCMKHGISPYS